jgi:hypothetical protein
MEWNQDCEACKNLWAALTQLRQIVNKSYKQSEMIKMNELTFYNSELGDEALRTEAKLVANGLDDIFKQSGAVYEEGVDHDSAIESMTEVLLDEEKTVHDLAHTVDPLYKFFQE